MQKNDFKEQFSKNNRPEITDLQTFWDQEIYMLFREFAEYILQKYDLRFGTPLWTERYGWTYRIGKSGVYLVNGIQIKKSGFVVNDIEICDRESYCLLLENLIWNLWKRIKSDAMGATVSLMEKQILDNVSVVINTRTESTGEVFEEITCRREQPKKPLITI